MAFHFWGSFWPLVWILEWKSGMEFVYTVNIKMLPEIIIFCSHCLSQENHFLKVTKIYLSVTSFLVLYFILHRRKLNKLYICTHKNFFTKMACKNLNSIGHMVAGSSHIRKTLMQELMKQICSPWGKGLSCEFFSLKWGSKAYVLNIANLTASY